MGYVRVTAALIGLRYSYVAAEKCASAFVSKLYGVAGKMRSFSLRLHLVHRLVFALLS